MPHKLIIKGQKIQGDLPKAHPLTDLESSLIFQLNLPNRTENWVNYSVLYKTPLTQMFFESPNLLLCLKPANELCELRDQLNKFLNNPLQKIYRFEPAEPSFELNLEKDENEGIKLIFWMDNGNTDCEYYTWDALGLRLYTDYIELGKFIEGLDDFLKLSPE